MYWLLSEEEQGEVRRKIESLTERLARITGRSQTDQLFPFVGRKDRRKGEVITEVLCPEGGVVVDPFAGSGVLVYGALEADREVVGNEWEIYTCRMASAPWRLPDPESLRGAYEEFVETVEPELDFLYQTECPCGRQHVIDSQFFDRVPRRYRDVDAHERLGDDGETITYRRHHNCPECGRTEKHFEDSDAEHLDRLAVMRAADVFDVDLIENARINLSGEFTRYGNLFPHRSKLALWELWRGIQTVECEEVVKGFLEDVFLSILPLAKYTDYRGKSQDLHCPERKLRENNLLHRYQRQFRRRRRTLYEYGFSGGGNDPEGVISERDFREFFEEVDDRTVDLLLTDPPWRDANPYFEKAQIYHPWLEYRLSDDEDRLRNEVVVSDAPSRPGKQSADQWWEDMDCFLNQADRCLAEHGFLALYVRPVPAAEWLTNVNRLKLLARKNGFEPLLSIDVGSQDPSMRLQQSASYVFSRNVVFVFVHLDDQERRFFFGEYDVDLAVYRTAAELQEELKGPFSRGEWREALGERFVNEGVAALNAPRHERRLGRLFDRYCEHMGDGNYLPRADCPFAGQVFDTPVVERLVRYIPVVVSELDEEKGVFSFEEFLLSLAVFVENGTRELIDDVERVDLERLLSSYAVEVDGGFQQRGLPELPEGIERVMELDPYQFEAFTAQRVRESGFEDIRVVGRTGDRGVDVIGTDPDGNRTVVQCKRWAGSVGAAPIQRLHSFSVTRGASRRICITTSQFTQQARDEAEQTDTMLVAGQDLERLIAEHMAEWA